MRQEPPLPDKRVGPYAGDAASRVSTQKLIPMTWKERERAFYVGAPLAIIPALGFLPAVVFLVVAPKVVHARAIAFVLLPLMAVAGSFGLWKLAIGAVQRPFGILNALSFGAMLVLMIVASYTGLFLALLTMRL